MAPTYPYSTDPLERTRYHEAGHAVVLWELFADVAAHVIATHAIDDFGGLGTSGITSFSSVDLKNFDVGVYRDVIAVYYGGREAVAKAVRRRRLENLTGRDPDEHSLGDRGFIRTSGIVAPFPYVDEDWVTYYAEKAERCQYGMGMSPDAMIRSEQLQTEGQELARQILQPRWHSVNRIVGGLRADHVLQKLQVRDLLINRR